MTLSDPRGIPLPDFAMRCQIAEHWSCSPDEVDEHPHTEVRAYWTYLNLKAKGEAAQQQRQAARQRLTGGR